MYIVHPSARPCSTPTHTHRSEAAAMIETSERKLSSVHAKIADVNGKRRDPKTSATAFAGWRRAAVIEKEQKKGAARLAEVLCRSERAERALVLRAVMEAMRQEYETTISRHIMWEGAVEDEAAGTSARTASEGGVQLPAAACFRHSHRSASSGDTPEGARAMRLAAAAALAIPMASAQRRVLCRAHREWFGGSGIHRRRHTSDPVGRGIAGVRRVFTSGRERRLVEAITVLRRCEAMQHEANSEREVHPSRSPPVTDVTARAHRPPGSSSTTTSTARSATGMAEPPSSSSSPRRAAAGYPEGPPTSCDEAATEAGTITLNRQQRQQQDSGGSRPPKVRRVKTVRALLDLAAAMAFATRRRLSKAMKHWKQFSRSTATPASAFPPTPPPPSAPLRPSFPSPASAALLRPSFPSPAAPFAAPRRLATFAGPTRGTPLLTQPLRYPSLLDEEAEAAAAGAEAGRGEDATTKSPRTPRSPLAALVERQQQEQWRIGGGVVESDFGSEVGPVDDADYDDKCEDGDEETHAVTEPRGDVQYHTKYGASAPPHTTADIIGSPARHAQRCLQRPLDTDGDGLPAGPSGLANAPAGENPTAAAGTRWPSPRGGRDTARGRGYPQRLLYGETNDGGDTAGIAELPSPVRRRRVRRNVLRHHHLGGSKNSAWEMMAGENDDEATENIRERWEEDESDGGGDGPGGALSAAGALIRGDHERRDTEAEDMRDVRHSRRIDRRYDSRHEREGGMRRSGYGVHQQLAETHQASEEDVTSLSPSSELDPRESTAADLIAAEGSISSSMVAEHGELASSAAAATNKRRRREGNTSEGRRKLINLVRQISDISTV
eukprot:GHVU01210628.1.p1 GENE.GHVU01210628.1~~GHVU01210628.1.p1  ORF type:complete len:838 (-),score=130.44 GHVU01210628.1:383-2896(-)